MPNPTRVMELLHELVEALPDAMPPGAPAMPGMQGKKGMTPMQLFVIVVSGKHGQRTLPRPPQRVTSPTPPDDDDTDDEGEDDD